MLYRKVILRNVYCFYFYTLGRGGETISKQKNFILFVKKTIYSVDANDVFIFFLILYFIGRSNAKKIASHSDVVANASHFVDRHS